VRCAVVGNAVAVVCDIPHRIMIPAAGITPENLTMQRMHHALRVVVHEHGPVVVAGADKVLHQQWLQRLAQSVFVPRVYVAIRISEGVDATMVEVRADEGGGCRIMTFARVVFTNLAVDAGTEFVLLLVVTGDGGPVTGCADAFIAVVAVAHARAVVRQRLRVIRVIWIFCLQTGTSSDVEEHIAVNIITTQPADVAAGPARGLEREHTCWHAKPLDPWAGAAAVIVPATNGKGTINNRSETRIKHNQMMILYGIGSNDHVPSWASIGRPLNLVGNGVPHVSLQNLRATGTHSELISTLIRSSADGQCHCRGNTGKQVALTTINISDSGLYINLSDACSGMVPNIHVGAKDVVAKHVLKAEAAPIVGTDPVGSTQRYREHPAIASGVLLEHGGQFKRLIFVELRIHTPLEVNAHLTTISGGVQIDSHHCFARQLVVPRVLLGATRVAQALTARVDAKRRILLGGLLGVLCVAVDLNKQQHKRDHAADDDVSHDCSP